MGHLHGAQRYEATGTKSLLYRPGIMIALFRGFFSV